MLTIKDPANYERLKKLAPLEAVQTWLDGNFTIGEDYALVFAIRTGTNTRLSDTRVIDLICYSIDCDDSAETCLSRIQGHHSD